MDFIVNKYSRKIRSMLHLHVKRLNFFSWNVTIGEQEGDKQMKIHKKLLSGMLAITLIGMSGCTGHYEDVSLAVVKTGIESDLQADAGENTKKNAEAERIADQAEKKDDSKEIRIALATEAAPENTAGAKTEEDVPEEPKIEDITLLFAGDVYLSNHVLNAYDKAGGIHGVLDEGIRAEIEAADVFMVNQEFPFTERGTKAADKQYTFRLPHDRLHLMNEMGIDIVTLANNHILDFGPEGITDSISALNEAGIKYVGAGENLEEAKKLEIVEVGGRKIGFLGTSRVYMATSWAAGENHPGVFSTYDPALPLEEIKKADELVDYLVVYVHWGIERNTQPENYQRVMGQQYIDAGADIVIGSHPHVLQPLEYYDGKPIMYSMGNFVFGSSIPSTELLKIEISAEDEMTVTEIPCTSSGGYTRLK